jgi:hypothetical protein
MSHKAFPIFFWPSPRDALAQGGKERRGRLDRRAALFVFSAAKDGARMVAGKAERYEGELSGRKEA